MRKATKYFKLNLHFHILWMYQHLTFTHLQSASSYTHCTTYKYIPKQLPCQRLKAYCVSRPAVLLQWHSSSPENEARHQIGRSGWRVGLPAILKLQSASWGGRRAVTQQCYNTSQEVLKPSRKMINMQFNWSDKQPRLAPFSARLEIYYTDEL